MPETRKEENFDSRRLFSLFQEVPNKLKLGVLSFIHKIERDILFFTRQKPVRPAESDQTMYIRGGFSTKPKIYHLLNYFTPFPDYIIINYFKVRVIHMRGELNIKFYFLSPSAFEHIN